MRVVKGMGVREGGRKWDREGVEVREGGREWDREGVERGLRRR